MNNFGSGMIDTTSVLSIINKINLYIDNEKKIINNTQNSLSLLCSYYSSDNSNVIDEKINNLYYNLSLMLENKKKYVVFITNVLNMYITLNESNTAKYKNL